ncbi:MAG: hypothetical protein PHR22_01700 [Candidatus Omnitrophica bacterium]|nr:hypothetical protein [Candidatus Omnitrophota bacterium]
MNKIIGACMLILANSLAAVSFAQDAVPHEQPARVINRAMWEWNSIEPILKEDKRKELFDFCEKHKINELFAQLHYSLSGGQDVKCELSYKDQLRSFLKDAHERKIRVHALDGDPTLILRGNHPKLLAEVKAILEFNAQGKPGERYDGIHLDNEPYLLVGYNGPFRKEVLLQFLEANKKCMDLMRASGRDVVYGVDIPYWFLEKGAGVDVKFGGTVKPVGEHIIDITDNIGVMDYRNFADGDDGIIAHGREEVEYATKAGKKVYIGVETYRPEPEHVIFIYGQPEFEFNKRLESVGGQFAKQYMHNGFRIKKLSDGKNVHIGIIVPPDKERQAKAEEALIEVGRIFGKDFYVPDKKAIDEALFDAEWAVSNEGAHEDFKVSTIPSGRSNRVYVRFEADMVTSPKITFAGMTKTALEKELAKTEEAFKGYRGFYGFAIHYYEPYRAMKE